MRAFPLAAVVAVAAVLPLVSVPAHAAEDPLLLQPDVVTTVPGGVINVTVMARLVPDGQSKVGVRTGDVTFTVSGGGTVAPASTDAGETRWIYTAPASVSGELAVDLRAQLRLFPLARGSVRVTVKAPEAPKPTPATPTAAVEDDEEGDEVANAVAQAAPAAGKLVTVEKWRVRLGEGSEWNDRTMPARGEDFYAPGAIHEFRFRVNEPDCQSLEVQWWRVDRPKKVRTFNPRNRHLDVSKDQDGLLHGRFNKALSREKGEYVFAVVVLTKDGRTLRENITVHRQKPPKDEEDEKEKKGGGKGKGKR